LTPRRALRESVPTFRSAAVSLRVCSLDVSTNALSASVGTPPEALSMMPGDEQRAVRPFCSGAPLPHEKYGTVSGNLGSMPLTGPGSLPAEHAASFSFQTLYASLRRNVL
jgi:hypothetical protein